MPRASQAPVKAIARAQRTVVGSVVVMVVGATASAALLSRSQPVVAYALIFAFVAGGLVTMFAAQLRGVAGAQTQEQVAPIKRLATGADPLALGERELWEMLAVVPVDPAAVAARAWVWKRARAAVLVAAVMTFGVFGMAAAAAWWGVAWAQAIGAAIVLVAALSVLPLRALAAKSDAIFRPLGFTVVARPRFGLRFDAMTSVAAHMRGRLVLEGERHGRLVGFSQHSDGSQVNSRLTVAAAGRAFKLTASSGRLRAGTGAPTAVVAAVDRVSRSRRWDGIEVSSGPNGIVVTRKGRPSDWLLDLWLAEMIASVLASA